MVIGASELKENSGHSLPERFLRFFNVINIKNPSEESLNSIFLQILKGFLFNQPFE
jgi:hypothetical protein